MALIAIQSIARRFIPAMLQLGMSANAGLRMLQGYELGYRRTIFLADWREFAGIERKRNPLQSIPKKNRPTESTIQRTEAVQRAKFNYNYKIEGYDLILQEDVETSITVASDDLVRMGEAEEVAQYLADQYKLDIEIAKMEIDSVTVRS